MSGADGETYLTIYTVLALGLISAFSAPALSASLADSDHTTKNIPAQTATNAENSSANQWWESYTHQTGFVEALWACQRCRRVSTRRQ